MVVVGRKETLATLALRVAQVVLAELRPGLALILLEETEELRVTVAQEAEQAGLRKVACSAIETLTKRLVEANLLVALGIRAVFPTPLIYFRVALAELEKLKALALAVQSKAMAEAEEAARTEVEKIMYSALLA